MGAPKQKWTSEEEAALKAGITKYGPGKWSTILKDPDFCDILSSRSNVDLKDKWRNINVMLNGFGSRQRGKGALKSVKISKSENHTLSVSGSSESEILDWKDLKPLATSSKDVKPLGIRSAKPLAICSKDAKPLAICSKDAKPLAICSNDAKPLGTLSKDANPLAAISKDSKALGIISREEPDSGSFGSTSRLDLEVLILEAVTELKEPRGSSRQSISQYIEEHYLDHPFLDGSLKQLTENGRLMKVKHLYKLPSSSTAPSVLLERVLMNSSNVEKHASIKSMTKEQIDAEVEKMLQMTPEEAAIAAAQAVAQAEAAVEEATRAAREAEVAEEEAEAARNFADAAQKAIKCSRTVRVW